MNDDKADARCKMGLHKWSQHPVPSTLKITERDPSCKCKIEIKFEDNNKTSNKRRMEN